MVGFEQNPKSFNAILNDYFIQNPSSLVSYINQQLWE